MMTRRYVVTGAVMAFFAVALGAFGAHGLSAFFAANPSAEANYHTGIEYLMYHALGVLAAGWAAERWPGSLTRWAGILLAVGGIIFAASLLILSLAGLRIMGAVAPIGGVAMLAGWACLAAAAWRGK